MKAVDERKFLAPADLRFVISFPRYGRLKLELLFERILHVRFRFCSRGLKQWHRILVMIPTGCSIDRASINFIKYQTRARAPTSSSWSFGPSALRPSYSASRSYPSHKFDRPTRKWYSFSSGFLRGPECRGKADCKKARRAWSLQAKL